MRFILDTSKPNFGVPNTVEKEMSPEQVAALKNATALINTALEAGTIAPVTPEGEMEPEATMKAVGAMGAAPEGAEQGRKENPAPDDKSKQLTKAIVSGGSDVNAKGKGSSDADGSTANSAAEGKISDISETDEENVKEVAKQLNVPYSVALKAYLAGKRGVAKSSIEDRIATVEKAMTNLVSAIMPDISQAGRVVDSVGDQVQKSNDRPVYTPESEQMANMVAKSLADAFEKEMGKRRIGATTQGDVVSDVRKSLREEGMPIISALAKGLWPQ